MKGTKPTGAEEQFISIQEGAKMTAKYREGRDTGTIIGGFFSQTTLKTILSQKGCIGVRYYFAQDFDKETEQYRPVLVLVGVDKENNDMVEGVIACLLYTSPSPRDA